MDDLNIGGKNNRTKHNGDVRKQINNFKNLDNKVFKSKPTSDRGDSGPIKDKIEPKNKVNTNISTSMRNFVSVKKEKRDAIIQDSEKKRDSDICKVINVERCETKSKNTLELNDEIIKDHSNARDEENVKFESTKTNIQNDKVNKKPLIKTMTHTDAKTYKTIEFTEQKQQKTLKIKLPHFTNDERTSIPKLINKSHLNKIDKINAEERINNKRNVKNKKFKHKRSPSPLRQDGGSPPTEISKWSPCNVSDHTKPVYEAWINTTLAAMSNKKKKEFVERQNILKSFQKAVEMRTKSPELVYENFADESFTGKIKINHRYR